MTKNIAEFNSNATIKLGNGTEKPFSEIIESCLDGFLAQCWSPETIPEFGSLVQVEHKSLIVIGCVTMVQTGSMDSTRYPFPYQKTESELKIEQPQIFAFLKTTFRAQIIGYIDTEKQKEYFLLPPHPCKIHAFVSQTSVAIEERFLKGPDFLHLLFSFSAQIPNLDECLLALLRYRMQRQGCSQQFLRDFCQSFSMLTGNDYRRLKLLLQRIELMLHGTMYER